MSVNKASAIQPLDPGSADPFYRQIYDRFRDAIAGGVLKPGDRIPSARAMTRELGLARGTIDAAYALLAAEGYIEARGQAGAVVPRDLKLPAEGKRRPPQPRPATAVTFRPDTILPFQMGL